jgi:mannose-6-phosphate isomerase-like protein (cupin superfamily)
MTRLQGFVEKGWGHEFIFASNDLYCGKILKFNKDARFSMHFHKDKDETWFVLTGAFEVRFLNTKDATVSSTIIKSGDVWHNPPLFPHQVICLEEGSLVEVSTPDSVEDNYRVGKGDSQNAKV